MADSKEFAADKMSPARASDDKSPPSGPSSPADIDAVLRSALHGAARQIPVPDPRQGLARPRALLETQTRRRRWRIVLPAGLVAGLLLLAALYGSALFPPEKQIAVELAAEGAEDRTLMMEEASPSPLESAAEEPGAIISQQQAAGEDADRPDAAEEPEIFSAGNARVETAALANRYTSMPQGQVVSLKEASRLVPFPLHAPEVVPPGVVRIGISVTADEPVHLTADFTPEDAEPAQRVILRYVAPDDSRLEIEQIGPWPDESKDGAAPVRGAPGAMEPAGEADPPAPGDSQEPRVGTELDEFDKGPSTRLEWVGEGVLFRVRSDWDEADTLLFLESLAPVAASTAGLP